MTLRSVLIAVAAIFIAIRCYVATPQGFTSDEQRSFGAALLDFDPYGHQPPPPAYPAYVAAGRLLNFFIRDPRVTLFALSFASAIVGFILFAISFGDLLRAPLLGIAASFLLYVSPPVRFLCAHATPEPLAFALVAAALVLQLRGRTLAFAVILASAAAVRPQMSVALLALLLVARPGWKAIAAFLVALAVAFEPVIEAIGFDRFDLYVKSIPSPHDAPLALPLHQFVIEPWGRATLVMFAAAIAGAIVCALRRNAAGLPIGAFTIVHLLFASVAATRVESVRPLVPALIGVSFFATAALSWSRRWTSPPSRS